MTEEKPKRARKVALTPAKDRPPGSRIHDVKPKVVENRHDDREGAPEVPTTGEIEHAEPVPERPVSFGTPGRIAVSSLEDAMNGAGLGSLRAALDEPDEPDEEREVAEDYRVVGTNVGGGIVHVLCDDDTPETLFIPNVHNAFDRIPGPGDRLVRYEGEASYRLVKGD